MSALANASSRDDDWPVVRLVPWTGPVDAEHPDANFLADVATTSLADPMPTLQRLADALDLPVGALARYVLAKWTTAGSEAVLAIGPSAITRLHDLVDRLAQLDLEPGHAGGRAGDADRRAAVADLVEQVQWLRHGVDDPSGTYPEGGAVDAAAAPGAAPADGP